MTYHRNFRVQSGSYGVSFGLENVTTLTRFVAR
jgi:hypothetical protein